VSRWPAGIVLALAATPPALAATLFGWNAIVTAQYALRGDETSGGGGWTDAGVLAARTVGIASALYLIGRGTVRGSYWLALAALAVAWVLALPEYTAIHG